MPESFNTSIKHSDFLPQNNICKFHNITNKFNRLFHKKKNLILNATKYKP